MGQTRNVSQHSVGPQGEHLICLPQRSQTAWWTSPGSNGTSLCVGWEEPEHSDASCLKHYKEMPIYLGLRLTDSQEYSSSINYGGRQERSSAVYGI